MENPTNHLKSKLKNTRPRAPIQLVLKVIHRLRGGTGLGPLSTRSVIALLLMLCLLIGPIRVSADIVSASLTYAFFMVLGCLTLIGITQGLILKQGVEISVLPPAESVGPHENVRVFLSLKKAQVLPFFVLDLALDFEHEGSSPALVRVSGLTRSARRVHLDLTFPHRGSWDIRGIRCVLRDVTGLTSYSWHVAHQTAITIAPPLAHDSHLPILSSTQRPGEMVVDVFNRQGEPFDIKSYHPSDGVKKIVWKAFAKRGELLSRHPEASMTPEGFVVMFVIAGVEGDAACAQAIAYSESVSSLNLEIIASCEGAHGRTPAHSPESFKELLIDSVWDANPDEPMLLRRDTAELLDYCRQLTPGITVKKLILFTSAERVSSTSHSKALHDLATWLSDQGISPVFCVTAPPALKALAPVSKISRLSHLIIAPEPSESPEVSATAYNDFLSSCLHQQWEVHV